MRNREGRPYITFIDYSGDAYDPEEREYRQVRMLKEVYDELIKMGTAGNSIGDVVARLIRFYKEHHHSVD
jgi:hypothetical protein